MPFDPNIPGPHAELTSPMFRDQYNGLKEIIDALAALVAAQQVIIADLQQQVAARPTAQQMLEAIAAYAARNVDAVGTLPPPWSDNPPERAEFNEMRDKIIEILSGLKHPA